MTFNRLVYLRRCIESIVATSNAEINVCDDGSDDGTINYLMECRKRGWVKHVYLNNRIGTAANFNILLNKADEVSVMANDDMYFFRDWEIEIMSIYYNHLDCGMVSFYDYTRYNLDKGNMILDDCLKVTRTGLGCSLIYKPLFDKVGGFSLPTGKKMGFLATPFCTAANKAKIERNKHYATLREYAHHMDLPRSRMCERDSLQEYCDLRKHLKK